MRPREWWRRLRARALRRSARREAAAGREHHALLLARRAMLCCPRTLPASCRLAAEILRQEAATSLGLRAAAALYRFVLAHADESSELRARARDRLILLACQQREEGLATALLLDAGYEYRLSPEILSYPLRTPEPHALAKSPRAHAHVVDGVLPAGMLRALQRALAPRSPFWRAHGYRCGHSPFFSYVHSLSRPPRNGLDRVLALLHRQAVAAFPAVAHATQAEWWAHCRPHATGHQLHYDSDDEGRGGVRNPTVSSALYLSEAVGGPTLVTSQRLSHPRLATHGWTATPRVNRVLYFDGALLHGVVPGRGPVGAAASPRGTRRISLMVAFWPSIRERSAARPAAARPFPYPPAEARSAEASASASWASLFDWPESSDGEPTPAVASASELRYVEPIWLPVDQEDGAARALPVGMPNYDACFQGFS
ncbi:hypothetical protein AB1Y20_007894 [Prymnesium parvum]|uniref:Fe2OG dioxygenase domain-containing protein n=1 Tax=Prymnesium parvum TaxID=97485 RepID=A0AB34IT70_PRYPA